MVSLPKRQSFLYSYPECTAKKKAERRTKGNEAFRTKTNFEIWFSYTFFSDEVWMIQITTFVSLFFPSLLLQPYWHSFLLGLYDNLSNPSVTQSLYVPFTHIKMGCWILVKYGKSIRLCPLMFISWAQQKSDQVWPWAYLRYLNAQR